ncbi:unnamed protein product [Protopolystoma xenopodis]|uniref:Phosphorylase b kinase regulatory subunit n=1 Tax=Protopolystoma xenopodis TaxID=117903 RepID=A0A3S5C0B3_9PLAT|nr:unnamed protein product [Protopolystoma xenopodis]
MRTILMGWMRQATRLEQFKKTQNLDTCLHSRFHYSTGEPIYNDDYKHLQMDCVGLFVLQLVQMISSGLQVASSSFTTDLFRLSTQKLKWPLFRISFST